MAKSSSYGLWLACFAIAAAVAGGTQFIVGGANGWSVPTVGAEPFNTWATRTRFQIGDSLVFVYPKDQDSVLLVEPADYNACNTSSYVKKFDDGDTVVTLDRSGPLFFISGVEANCRANEKLIVMVLATRSNGTAPAPSTAPPPASPASPPPVSSTTPPPSSSPAPPTKAPTTASPPALLPPAGSAPPPPPASAPTKAPSTPPPASSSPPAPSASSPAPASSTSTPPPPSATATAPQAPPPPSASSPAPSAHGTTANSTGTPSSPPAGASKDKNGAALTVATATGLASSFGACILGYAMLAL